MLFLAPLEALIDHKHYNIPKYLYNGGLDDRHVQAIGYKHIARIEGKFYFLQIVLNKVVWASVIKTQGAKGASLYCVVVVVPALGPFVLKHLKKLDTQKLISNMLIQVLFRIFNNLRVVSYSPSIGL